MAAQEVQQNDVGVNKYFKNCVRIVIENREILVTRMDILKNISVFEGVKENLLYISKFEYGNNWMLEFKSEFNVSVLIGKEILVNDSKATIGFGFDKYVYRTYRLLWAPINFEREVIKDFFGKLNKDIEIIGIEDEWYEEEGWKLLSGNIRIKIRALNSLKDTISIPTGKINMEDYKLFLSRVGEKQACHICNSFDHFRRDCKQICSVCKQTGHKDGGCRRSYATSVSAQDANQIHFDTNDLDQFPKESTSTNSQEKTVPSAVPKPVLNKQSIENRQKLARGHSNLSDSTVNSPSPINKKLKEDELNSTMNTSEGVDNQSEESSLDNEDDAELKKLAASLEEQFIAKAISNNTYFNNEHSN